MTHLDNINSNESIKTSSKTAKFLQNTQNAIKKALTTTGIVVSSFLPTSVSTITTTPLAGTVTSTIGIGTAASLLSACSSDSPEETKDTTAPTIYINNKEVDITGGKEIKINGNQLYIGDILIATRTDNESKNCNVELSLNGKSISSGTTIYEGGTLTIKVSDMSKNSKTENIKLTIEQDVSGFENLKNISLQVDQEINLLKGVNFGNGAKLEKLEIEIDGQRIEISDPQHYTPSYPGTCNIILTIKDKDGNLVEYKTDTLTIKPLDYKAMEINNIKPVDILPIIGQVAVGDKECYNHIEHLRLAEATRIRDMMREYGAGNHSKEEYQQLMSRLNTGMTGEHPLGYDNYEIIGGSLGGKADDHAHTERNTLATLINHANLKVICPNGISRRDVLLEYIKNNPNSINIFGNSAYKTASNKSDFDNRMEDKNLENLCNLNNCIIFAAGTNISHPGGVIKNKIYNGEYEADEHGMYSLASLANSDKNTQPHSHLLVTIATDKTGDIDQTNETRESSKYPVGFHQKSLFSGRSFPYHSTEDGTIHAKAGKIPTSHTNYVNVAMADLCFQMFAEVKDVNELLNMIKSTCLTDYIRFNGETQELQLINPAGFFKKYLMPTNLPNNLKSDQIISLDKGYYKGVIFNIPGAEVKINGKWVAYNDTNKSQIKNQNPMNLEWRLNGDLCKKMGYKGKSVSGKIIVADDKWNGLNIDTEFSISIQ